MIQPSAVEGPFFDEVDRLIQDGRLKEAAVSLKKIVAAAGDGPDARLRLGRLQVRMGLKARAEKTFQDALKLDPDSRRPLTKKEIYLALGRLHEQAGRLGESRADLFKAECVDKPVKWRRLEKQRASKGHKARKSAFSDSDQKTLIIDGTTRCNQACLFCFERQLHDTKRDHTLPEIKRVVLQAKKDGYQIVMFMGGEITLVSWLAPAIKFIKRSGLKAGIATNGVLLSSPQYVERLKKAGIDWIEASPLSHIPEDDDKLGLLKGALAMRLQALRNINDAGIPLCLNIVVNSVNVGYLREMIASLRRFKIERLTLKMLHITENVEDKNLIPRYGAMRPRVEEAMAYMEEEGMPFRFEGIPLCVVSPRYHARQENKRNLSGFGYQYNSEAETTVFPEFLYPHADASPKCIGCALNKFCYTQPHYVRIFGDDELRPSAAPVEAR